MRPLLTQGGDAARQVAHGPPKCAGRSRFQRPGLSRSGPPARRPVLAAVAVSLAGDARPGARTRGPFEARPGSCPRWRPWPVGLAPGARGRRGAA
jgi:hypothetical protein